ncbi:MAG TPA: pentapeptide repeat-containing protein [Chroococcales cyanobacterium]
MSPSELENRYPDSLYLDLTANPVSSSGTQLKQIDLYLTIDFHEQWQPMGAGRIKFGFKGGKLQLRLENGIIPDECRHIKGSRKLSPEPNTQLPPVACSAIAAGTEQSPVWIWQGNTGVSVLQGSLKPTKLATVQVTGEPCQIDAVFTVSPSDIYLTSAEGLWLHQIRPNQLAVIERKLVLFLLESKLQPYLSRVVWQYSEDNGLQKLSPLQTDEQEQEFDTTKTTELAELEELIQRLATTKTDNFFELAKIANLEPITDFVGAKLLGVNLNGTDLSGANLHRAYLRGADLSDADLSDADLVGANLGGADLSGAYLSNADLSGADLHRASLALANLSSTNLSGANLSEANLSSANFSDANLNEANFTHADLHRASLMLAKLNGTVWQNTKVEEARFGKNLGLSEPDKLELQQRGAMFEEDIASG